MNYNNIKEPVEMNLITELKEAKAKVKKLSSEVSAAVEEESKIRQKLAEYRYLGKVIHTAGSVYIKIDEIVETGLFSMNVAGRRIDHRYICKNTFIYVRGLSYNKDNTYMLSIDDNINLLNGEIDMDFDFDNIYENGDPEVEKFMDCSGKLIDCIGRPVPVTVINNGKMKKMLIWSYDAERNMFLCKDRDEDSEPGIDDVYVHNYEILI